MSSLDSGFMLALFHDSGHSCVDRNKFHAFYITGVNISEESFHIQNRISSRPVAVFFKFTRALQTSLSIRQFGHLHALCNLYVDRMHAVLIIAELPKIIIRAVQRLFIQSSVSKVRHWEMKSTFFYHLQLPRILEGFLQLWLITNKHCFLTCFIRLIIAVFNINGLIRRNMTETFI